QGHVSGPEGRARGDARRQGHCPRRDQGVRVHDQKGVKSTGDSRQSPVSGARAAVAALFLAAAALAGPTSPDRPVPRSPDGPQGEVDAAGLLERIGREKGKVVLVNFWATWCVPCREEFPDLSRLQSAYAGKGLRVIGVSTDFARESAAVAKFMGEQKPSFPNY